MTSKWLKRTAVMLAVAMTLGLAGCNKEPEESSSDSSDTSDTEVLAPQRKVGYIFHGSADEGASGQMNYHRVMASNRSSMETCYIDKVNISDFENAVKQLVEAGCTEIVSCSPIYANMLGSVSGKYMNIDFISYGSTGGGANVSPYTETPYQGAYIAGMAAAFNSNAQKIGFVADTDLLYSIPCVNAAALGAQIVFSNPTVYAAAAMRDSEIAEAVDALVDKGCDVIICYTESNYSAEYCERKGVKFIGNLDYSDSEADYSNMLMYFYNKLDSYFLAQFKQMQLDTWTPDVYTGTMGNGIINVSAALPAAKDGTQKLIDTLVPKVTSGAAYIFDGEITDNDGKIRYTQSETMSENAIYSMQWYVRGVEVIKNFRRPQTELPAHSFEIKS